MKMKNYARMRIYLLPGLAYVFSDSGVARYKAQTDVFRKCQLNVLFYCFSCQLYLSTCVVFISLELKLTSDLRGNITLRDGIQRRHSVCIQISAETKLH